MNKQVLMILTGILLTGTAMAAFISEKMKTTVMCTDVRIAMNDSLAAGIEIGGLKRHNAVTIYTQKINGKTTLIKQGSVDVFRYLKSSENLEKYSGRGLELNISKVKDKHGAFPATLHAELEGKKFAANLMCSPTR
jgi:hypothetical protein